MSELARATEVKMSSALGDDLNTARTLTAAAGLRW